jgi:glycosyltransferase involved in cell wall biosynthesis
MCHIDSKRMIDNMEEAHREALLRSKYIQVLMPSYMAVVKKAGFKNVVCIPNVVEQMNNKINLYKEKDSYNIITVGRVEREQKRTHLLVEVFIKVADKFPNWNVEIYGDLKQSSYIKMIKKMIKIKKMENRIHLNGVTKHVKKRLQEADIFAFPSAYEGFSLALTEAMSIGLPAIGYKNCSSVNDLIIDGINGFLCEDGVDSFSEKLAILMENEELRINMGESAYRSMKSFAPKEIWDKWENLILGISPEAIEATNILPKKHKIHFHIYTGASNPPKLFLRKQSKIIYRAAAPVEILTKALETEFARENVTKYTIINCNCIGLVQDII